MRIFSGIVLLVLGFAVTAAELKPLLLKYDSPAPDSNQGWVNYSLPIGNGYMGGNVFGIPERERIQITQNSLLGVKGVNNFAELYFQFPHSKVTNYKRSLDLRQAVATVEYDVDGVHYKREIFTSYPDEVLVVRFSASKPGKVSFVAAPVIPYVREYAVKPGDGWGKSGKVTAQNDTITLAGRYKHSKLDFVGKMKIVPAGGELIAGPDGTVEVKNADQAVVVFAIGNNYKMESRVFTEKYIWKKNRPDPNLEKRVSQIADRAAAKSYDDLYRNHQKDYQSLFGRVELEIGGDGRERFTDKRLKDYKASQSDIDLETLFFQYGRYLLICSSRKGTLPPNLQGIWNVHDAPPWTAGYWHNINVQMNYWPVFSTNLTELFESYADFNLAFRDKARMNADAYTKTNHPEALGPAGTNGWAVGTAASAISVSAPGGHSGPGTGGLTAKLFWDYYDFSRDPKILENIVYPTIREMDIFLNKQIRPFGDLLLTSPSASPENGHKSIIFDGVAFDQQMIAENHSDYLKAAGILGKNDAPIHARNEFIHKLDPIQVGYSGQIKEYRVELFYGELGEYRHRHLSHLVALYPGSMINDKTPAWQDAARVSLNHRGDKSTGWAVAHRINAWARLKDGERAYRLYRILLSSCTLMNLWDTHPPFQIDGNFGGTAGVAEMLLQSHDDCIEPLPALPRAWSKGYFRGLLARGNFEVDAAWNERRLKRLGIHSVMGSLCRISYPMVGGAKVLDGDGKAVDFKKINRNLIEFATVKGGRYWLTDIPARPELQPVEKVKTVEQADGSVVFSWHNPNQNSKVDILKATGSSPVFAVAQRTVSGSSWTWRPSADERSQVAAFRLIAVTPEGDAGEPFRCVVAPVIPVKTAVAYTLPTGELQVELGVDFPASRYRVYRGENRIAESDYPVFVITPRDAALPLFAETVVGGKAGPRREIAVKKSLPPIDKSTLVRQLGVKKLYKGGIYNIRSEAGINVRDKAEKVLDDRNSTKEQIAQAEDALRKLPKPFMDDLIWLRKVKVTTSASTTEKINDGISDFCSVSANKGPVEIEIELEKRSVLNKLSIMKVMPSRCKNISISVFRDGKWHLILDKQELKENDRWFGTTEFDLRSAVGDKVRITVERQAGNRGFSFREVEIGGHLEER